MHNLKQFLQRHPILTYVILVYLFEIGSVLIAFRTPDFLPLLLSIWPALAAILITALVEGRTGLKNLLRGLARWRIGLAGAAIVLGIPLLGTLAMVLVAALTRSPSVFEFGTLSPVLLVFSLIFNASEELGWRGFMLPRMLRSRPALPASLMIGVLWGAVHLPLHLPGQWYSSLPIWPTPVILIAYSVLLAWVYQRTRGSVLAAAMFHALLNSLTPLTAGIDLTLAWWLRAAVFASLALIVAILAGPDLSQQSAPQSETM